MVAERPKRRTVTWRAILLGLLLIPINVYWLIQIDVVRHTGVVTKMSMFYNAVCWLFGLGILNLLMRAVRPRWALTGTELLVVYALLNLATAVGGIDMLQALVPSMTHPFWFATDSNRWAETFHRYLPSWLTVRDKEILTALYEGHSTLYTWPHLRPWLGPALAWLGFTLVLLWAMLCLNVLLRRRWQEEERLTYPLVRLPLEFAPDPARFLRQRALWLGLGLAATIDLLGGLNYWYPWVPHVDLRAYRGVQVFTDPPWNAVGKLEFGTPPFVVGIGYLLPLPMLFSCWFFFILTKVELVLTAAIGYGEDPRLPYLNEQCFGAYLGIALLVFWNGRTYWREVWDKAWGRPSRLGEQDEALSYRAGLSGVLVGFGLLVLFLWQAGMSLGFAGSFLGLVLLLSLALTRLRAELGPPVHDLPYASPGQVLALVLGPSELGPRNLTLTALTLWFNRGYRCHPMPAQLEAFKMIAPRGREARRLLMALTLAGALAAFSTFWALLHVFYVEGQATAKIRGEPVHYGNYAYNQLQTWLQVPLEPDARALLFILAATVFTLLLNWGRRRYTWWPLPPVGYVLQGGWMMRHIWFGLFWAWVIKTLLLRYGGLRLYRTALPFFLGLILGEFLVAGLWSLIGWALDIPTWSFWS